MELTTANERQLEQVYALYLEAFPEIERKPFSLILEKQRQGAGEILAITEGEEFLGMAITVGYRDLVLLDYFAVCGSRRGDGIGGQALALLKEWYKGRRLFLEIETTLKPHEELALRQRRKEFYLRNGMVEAGFTVMLVGVEMEVLTDGSPLTYPEYIQLYRNNFSEKITSRIWETTEAE